MAKKNEVKPAEKKQVDKPENKERKAKLNLKRFPVRKMPKLFKKAYTPAQFQKKLIKNLYVPADKEDLKELFVKGGNPKYPEKLAIPRDRKFSWIEIRDYKWVAKEIKQNRKGVVKLAPLLALVGAIAALVVVVGIFKNPLAKKAIKAGCEAAFGAKTDVGSVDLKIMSASLTVNNIAVGNKDSVMKNLFQVGMVKVDFNLIQALRGRFDAQELEVTDVAWNTDRTTSCELPPKKQKAQKKEEEKQDSKFVTDLKAKSENALTELKTQATDMLGGTDVDSIVANIKSQLKTQTAVDTAKTQVTDLTNKWKAKPAEMQKQVSDFSASVSKLQKLDVSKIKDVATLKATLDEVNKAMETGNKLKSEAETTTNDIKNDAATVKKVGEDVTAAVASDMELAKSKLDAAKSAVTNAKSLMNNALDTIGYNMLGKYYPYVKKAIAYGMKLKNSSSKNKDKTEKKSTKKEGSRRLAGTTFWYAQETPSFLIEHVLATGTGFSAEATEITSDQDVRGKPMTVKGTYAQGAIQHAADFILDARSTSTAPLITVDYNGNGFTAAVDGTTIAAKSGVPTVNGKANIAMQLTGGSDGFSASGKVNLNPLTLSSDGFDNEMVTKYYNQALESVKKMDVSFKAAFSEADGVSMALNGNFADVFADALKSVLSGMGSDAKDAALKKIQEEINGSSSGVLADVKSFAGIQGDIDLQNTKLSDVNKILDSKKAELEEKIKSAATDAVKAKVGDKASGAAGDATSKLKGKLGL